MATNRTNRTERTNTPRFTYEHFREIAGDNTNIVIYQRQLNDLIRDINNRPHINAIIREDLGPDDGVWINGVDVHVEPDQLDRNMREQFEAYTLNPSPVLGDVPIRGNEEAITNADPRMLPPDAFNMDHVQQMRDQLRGEPPNIDNARANLTAYARDQLQGAPPLRFNTRDDQFDAVRYGGMGLNPIEQPVEIPVLQLDARMLTHNEVRSNIDFRTVRHDYDTRVAITGTMRLRLAVQSPLDRGRERIQEEIMQDQLIDAFMARLNRGHGRVDYRGIDDELRDFIFFLHKNIAPEFRVEADEKFRAMRDSIWPDTTETSPILPEEFE